MASSHKTLVCYTKLKDVETSLRGMQTQLEEKGEPAGLRQ
jgi:hypothetical protein